MAVRAKPSEVRWGRVAAWSLYDFANSPFSTIMTTVGFPLFFMEVLAPGRQRALQWGMLYGLSMVTAALLSPALGAWSDELGRRKPFLVFFTMLSICGTGACALLGPGDLLWAWAAFGTANVGFACAGVFYNALLVEVAPPSKLEAISGIGWGTGYVGGILGLTLAIPLYAGGTGLDNLGKVRLSFLLVAGIFLAFSVPIFLMKERGGSAEGKASGMIRAYRETWKTLKAIRAHKPFFFFLLASFFFNDGLNTVIIFAGPYARELFQMEAREILLLFIALNGVAALGAFVLGRLSDRWGEKPTLMGLVACWTLLAAGLALVGSRGAFFAATGMAGFLLGATQSIARGFAAKLAPREKEGEFFGFFGMVGKVAALLGPVLFGLTSSLAGTMRAGSWSMVPLFLLGMVFLSLVREKEGGRRPRPRLL